MQIKSKFSRPARGLLYRLKYSLNKRKKYLADVCRYLMVPKGWIITDQYTFQNVLQKCQVHFSQNQTELLYIQFIDFIGGPNNEFKLGIIKESLEDINQNDNPAIQMDSEYDQIRQRFEQSENIWETIENIAIEKEDLLDAESIKYIFNNINYKNQHMEKTIIEKLMKGDQAILVNQFKKRLELSGQQGKSKIEQLLKCQLLKGKCQRLTKYINPHSISNKLFLNMAADYLKQNKIYKDDGDKSKSNTGNPLCPKAVAVVNLGQDKINYFLFSRAETNLIQYLRKVLIKCISSQDVIQGQIKDTYFLYAMSIIVNKYPKLILNLFTLFKNPSHIYDIRLFIDGQWFNINIDTQFQTNINGYYCGARPSDQIIWPMLLQKAFAKINGSYESIQNGTIEQGMTLLTGAPSIHFDLVKGDNFWKTAQDQLNREYVLTCWDKPLINSDRQLEGLVKDRFYSLLQVIPDISGCDNKKVILFKLRDSQGRQTTWKGKWALSDTIWTKQLRKRLRYVVDLMDGTFFMCQEDFYKYFAYVNICRIKTQNKHSSFKWQHTNGKFAAVSIRINKKGNYYFTNYLQNRRQNRNKYSDQKYSWMILLSGKTFQKINCNLHNNFNTTIQSVGQLQKGDYILISMIKWQQKNLKQHYCLSSYGPGATNMRLCEFSPTYFENEVYTDFLAVEKKQFYLNKNIFRQVRLYSQSLFGLIVVQNQQKGILDLKISFQNKEGIIFPSSHPRVHAGEKIILKLILRQIIQESSIKFEYEYLKNN